MCFDCLTGAGDGGRRAVHVPSRDTLPSSSSLDSPVDSKAGWLLKRDKKKFMVMSSERVFCLLKEGVLFYFTKQKTNPKNFETDPDFIGQTDLAGATCKMTIEATHRFGIEIACQNGSGQVIQLNAESHADQKHWYDALMEHIEIANDAVLRAQGLANDGMKSWYEQKLAEQKAAVASLQKGRKLRKHYLALGFHRMHDRLICLDATGKVLLWCDPYASPSDRGDLTPTNSFPLVDIISVKLGAETAPLSSLAASAESAAKCFSIITAEKSYDFECETRDQRDDFVTLLNIVRDHLEREEITEEMELKKKNDERRKGLRDSLKKSQDLLHGRASKATAAGAEMATRR